MDPCVIYTRISADRSGEQAGVKRQEAECRKLARSRGYKVTQVFCDNDTSAYAGSRPDWDQMLGAIRSDGVTVVVAWANDRLYRQVQDQLDLMHALEKVGGRIVTVNDGELDPTTADGQLRMSILASVGQFESKRKSERLKSAFAQMAMQGRPHPGGSRPMGYKYNSKNQTYDIVDKEADLIRKWADDVLSGRNLTAITRDLILADIKTPQGKRFRVKTVRDILIGPVVSGRREYKGQVFDGNWDPIIPVAKQERVIATLEQTRSQYKGGATTGTKYLLSGLMVCGVCGTKMYRSSTKGYVCAVTSGGKGCVAVSAHRADIEVWSQVTERKLPARRAGSRDESKIDALVDERLKLLKSKDGWTLKLLDGVIDDRAYTLGTTKMDLRIREIEQALASAPIPSSSRMRRLIPTDPADLAARREYIQQMTEKIIVKPTTKRSWDPSRLQVIWR